MPVAPRPRTYVCPACGWSKTLAPKSDALGPGDLLLGDCPQCGHAPLDSREPSSIDLLLAKMAGAVSRHR